MTLVSPQPSENLPLTGLCLLVTRQDSHEFSLGEMLKSKGASVLTTPMYQILPPLSWDQFDRAVSKVSKIDWAVFTSSNGVTNCLSRLKDLDFSPKKIFSTIKIACVGRVTASKLIENGINPDLVPEHFQTEGLISAFTKFDLQEKFFWLIQAESPRKSLIDFLKKKRSKIIFTPVYRNVPVLRDYSFLLDELHQSKLDWILFASPSAVQNFHKILPDGFWYSLSAEPKIGCIGEITATTVMSLGWEVKLKPKIQNFKHLVQALCEINLNSISKKLL